MPLGKRLRAQRCRWRGVNVTVTTAPIPGGFPWGEARPCAGPGCVRWDFIPPPLCSWRTVGQGGGGSPRVLEEVVIGVQEV